MPELILDLKYMESTYVPDNIDNGIGRTEVDWFRSFTRKVAVAIALDAYLLILLVPCF